MRANRCRRPRPWMFGWCKIARPPRYTGRCHPASTFVYVHSDARYHSALKSQRTRYECPRESFGICIPQLFKENALGYGVKALHSKRIENVFYKLTRQAAMLLSHWPASATGWMHRSKTSRSLIHSFRTQSGDVLALQRSRHSRKFDV